MMRWAIALMIISLAFAGCMGAGPYDDADDARLDVRTSPWTDEVDRPVDATLGATGQWLAPFDGEEAAIHTVLLSDGRVLFWSGLHFHSDNPVDNLLDGFTHAETRVMDLQGATPVVMTPDPADGGGSDIFCSGHVLLPDGTVLAAGGSTKGGYIDNEFFMGTKDVRIYQPETDSWEQRDPMAHARWYATVLGLPDGNALIASGAENVGDLDGLVPRHEVFDLETGQVRELPASADRVLPMYPRLYVVPSGPLAGTVLFAAGGCSYCAVPDFTSIEPHWNRYATLDLETNTWSEHDAGIFGFRNGGVSALLPLRPPHYDARLLVAGGTLGASPVATGTAEILDLSVSPPTSSLAAPMEQGRWFGNHVLLPDGTLLVTGGSHLEGIVITGSDSASAILEPELFDPEATDPLTGLPGSWRSLPPMNLPRVYHSTSILLPDARVLIGGSAPASGIFLGDEVFEILFEIYEPPYLFRGARPAIDDAPASVAWGETFTVNTQDAADVSSVLLVRTGSTTHVLNAEQRLIELVIEQSGDDALQVVAPPDAALAPPGAYMLFLLKDTPEGPVPSVAAMMQLGAQEIGP